MASDMTDRAIAHIFQPSVLTRSRVRLAYGVAITVDALQWVLGPPGWLFADEILDVAAMALISGAIGFHPLLLPTFALEIKAIAATSRISSANSQPGGPSTH